jgi:hypothetical protein
MGLSWTPGNGAAHHRIRHSRTSSRTFTSPDGLTAAEPELCLTEVTLLDPRDWRWPDDGDEEWPLCWICLALTHVES